MEPLTAAQKETYDHIVEMWPKVPTYRELQIKAGLKSSMPIQLRLDALERKGWIKRTPGVSRSIELIGGMNGEYMFIPNAVRPQVDAVLQGVEG